MRWARPRRRCWATLPSTRASGCSSWSAISCAMAPAGFPPSGRSTCVSRGSGSTTPRSPRRSRLPSCSLCPSWWRCWEAARDRPRRSAPAALVAPGWLWRLVQCARLPLCPARRRLRLCLAGRPVAPGTRSHTAGAYWRDRLDVAGPGGEPGKCKLGGDRRVPPHSRHLELDRSLGDHPPYAGTDACPHHVRVIRSSDSNEQVHVRLWPRLCENAVDDRILLRFGRRIRWRALSLALTAVRARCFPSG